MKNSKSIDNTISDMEKILAICKFVKEKIPDVKYHQSGYYKGFSSKSINSIYNKFYFIKNSEVLYVVPYLELDFVYNGIEEKIRINSSPRSSVLAKAYWSYTFEQNVIKFSRFKVNFKNNKFKDDMINECQSQIVKFIKDHKGYKLIDKNLDPKIKKLLLFI